MLYIIFQKLFGHQMAEFHINIEGMYSGDGLLEIFNDRPEPIVPPKVQIKGKGCFWKKLSGGVWWQLIFFSVGYCSLMNLFYLGGRGFREILYYHFNSVGGWVFYQIDSFGCCFFYKCISVVGWKKKCLQMPQYNYFWNNPNYVRAPVTLL